MERVLYTFSCLWTSLLYDFLLTVRLRMLSSKISVHRHFLSSILLLSSRELPPPTLIAAIPAVKLDKAAAEGSRSTTLTTALPSRTLRTLSTSQFLAAPVTDEEDEGVVCPLNASQNALPNFLNRVCPASTASAAFWSRCSRSFSFSLDRSNEPLKPRFGEPGGVGRPPYDEYELDANDECFPDKSAESVE